MKQLTYPAAIFAIALSLFFTATLANTTIASDIKDESASPKQTEKANLVIYPKEKTIHPISRYITGKFCEHLYFNITNGMDAQILKNPTLCEYPFSTGQESPDGVATFHFDREEIARRIRNGAPRWGWPKEEIDGLAQSWKGALACWWTKLGSVETSPDVGLNGGRAQRIHIQSSGHGIAQWTWLPLHRTRKYQFELWARSPDITKLTIAVFEPSGKTICTQQTISDINSQWRKFSGSLEIPANLPSDKAYKFAIIAEQPGQLILERVLLYPADHINRADPDIVRFLRESHLPILRWPGGNFVSGYHWRDGVGPLEQRLTLPNYAWGQQENNFFGTDEFIAFCRAVGCEPMICINAGSGSLQEAADWVEYCNGSVDTPMGKLRAANGHPEPYNVKHWEIGNELWGRWQYYWTSAEGYVDRYRQFLTAMLKADPNITLYACGAPVFWGKHWNNTLITRTADILSRTTDHPLIGGHVPADTEPLDVFSDFMVVPEVLEQKWADLEKSMRQANIKDSRLAITELQMFARIGQPSSSEAVRKLTHDTLVSPATQAEALYDVLIYHTAVRLAPFVEMVTHSATVNHGGGLRKERERVYANPCHYAQAMFAAFADATPIKVELSCSEMEAPMVLPDLKNVASEWRYKTIDSVAVLAPDGSLLISIVHKGTDKSIDLEINIKDFDAEKPAEIQTLIAEKPWLGNSLEQPERITPQETKGIIKNGKLNLSIKPYSVVCIRIPSSK
jgi:alpha-N-arabinofuranosidase